MVSKKKRISSTQGHLSNDDAGEILSQVLLGEGEIILLAHLSQENNIPSLAQETVGKFVKKIWNKYTKRHYFRFDL